MKRFAVALMLMGMTIIFLAPAALAGVDVSLDVDPAQSKASQPTPASPLTGIEALAAIAAACAFVALGGSLLRSRIEVDGDPGGAR